MRAAIGLVLAALALSPVLTGCVEAKNQDDAAIEGVILNFGQDYFFPLDGTAAIRVKSGSDDLPDGVCVKLWARTEQEEVLAPIDHSNLTAEDHFIRENVLAIERRRVSGSVFDENGAERCGFGRIERIRGVASIADIEVSAFTPASGKEVWFLHRDDTSEIKFGPRIQVRRWMPESHACVEAMAALSPPGRFETYARGIRIFEVLWSAPHTGRSSEGCAFPPDPRP